MRVRQIKTTVQIVEQNNLEFLSSMDTGIVDLIYIDPPFNTGHTQCRNKKLAYDDRFFDYESFIHPRLVEAHRILSATGSLFFHIDYRESHYCKILLDTIFGRDCFMNEIIWAYDYGGRSKRRWSSKHDTIFWYVKDPKNYTFNFDKMERIPYMAPGLVGKEKAAIGKTPTDVWWHTIVPTNGKEKTGYPTQKPLGVLNRIMSVHTNPGDLVLDFFAGSGTTGAAALLANCNVILVDSNPDSIKVIQQRLGGQS